MVRQPPFPSSPALVYDRIKAEHQNESVQEVEGCPCPFREGDYGAIRMSSFVSPCAWHATYSSTTGQIRAINDNGLTPGLNMSYCGERPDSSKCDEDRQKIDAAFYREALAPTDDKPHWCDQLIACEFKVEKRSGGALQDPFDDVRGSDDGVSSSNLDHRKKHLGQIISYAELLFAMQHRVAVFMLLVLGRKCRFIRWDRSGFVVTRAFDYYKRWRTFVDILWRIS